MVWFGKYGGDPCECGEDNCGYCGRVGEPKEPPPLTDKQIIIQLQDGVNYWKAKFEDHNISEIRDRYASAIREIAEVRAENERLSALKKDVDVKDPIMMTDKQVLQATIERKNKKIQELQDTCGRLSSDNFDLEERLENIDEELCDNFHAWKNRLLRGEAR